MIVCKGIDSCFWDMVFALDVKCTFLLQYIKFCMFGR